MTREEKSAEIMRLEIEVSKLEHQAGAHCPDSCYQCEYHGKCLDEAEFDQ